MTAELQAIAKQAQAQKEYMIKLRRDFHRHPELSWQEYRSRDVICKELEAMGIPHEVVEGTGVLAWLGPEGGPRVGLRADMDALPIQEESEKPYASQAPGVMHACGHDGHMAVLLGVAAILRQHQLPRGVTLVFQPAEEGMSGGRKMAALPQMEDIANIAAIHLWSTLPVGSVSVEEGPRMARADLFEMTVTGEDSHGSMPHMGVDALYVASVLVTALQGLISRETDPRDAAVLTVGTLHAGVAPNVLASKAVLTGTLRSFCDEVGDRLARRVEEMGRQISAAFGAAFAYRHTLGVPPLVNDPQSSAVARSCAQAAVGAQGVVLMQKTTAAEDFAYYLRKRPGMLAFVGAGNAQKGIHKPHHHCAFDIDEDALVHAAVFLAGYALEMGKALGKESSLERDANA